MTISCGWLKEDSAEAAKHEMQSGLSLVGESMEVVERRWQGTAAGFEACHLEWLLIVFLGGFAFVSHWIGLTTVNRVTLRKFWFKKVNI